MAERREERPRAHGEEQFDRELSMRGIVGFLIGLVVVMLVVAVVIWQLSGGLKEHLVAQDPPPSPLPEANVFQLPPEPRLQVDPEGELAAMRAGEEKILFSYEWIDRDAGIVRVPIDEAMDWVAEHGVPAWRETVPDSTAETGSE